MLRTGHLLHPASHPASRPRTGASLPGTLASPRTGLAPAGCPQLSLGYVITTRTSLLSWRPSCWTHPLITGYVATYRHIAGIARYRLGRHWAIAFRTTGTASAHCSRYNLVVVRGTRASPSVSAADVGVGRS